ncbi:MAG: DUF4003 domain-containing protein [Methanomassiliicoccaceae archaeon]|nr:DUF4003 domain-containing protein [Methanomassiliicoccaceae archaeon]
MKHGTRWKLELFAENARKAKKGLRAKNAKIKRLVALIYALEGKPLDCDAVMSSYAAIKSSEGVLSVFRGRTSLCIAAMLSLKGNPKTLFDRTVAVYDMMNKRFLKSDFLAVAALMVAVNADPEDYPQIVSRMRSFHDGMKAQRQSYAGAAEYICTAMLALSNADPRNDVERIKRMYDILRPELSTETALALAQIALASGVSDVQAADRILKLKGMTKDRKMPLDPIMLGVLALLPSDAEAILQDIIETQALLRTKKGLGALFARKQEMLLYAAAVIASGYTEDTKEDQVIAVASTGIFSTIIAINAVAIATMDPSIGILAIEVISSS